MNEQTQYTKVMLLILIFLLLGGSIVGYSAINAKRSSESENNGTKQVAGPTVIPTRLPHPIHGMMQLRLENAAAPSVDKPFVVTLVATSGANKIAGFDVVMTYDKIAFDRKAVQSNDASFTLFTFDTNNRVSVSAAKQLQASEVTEFANTPILSFTFVPKKKGRFVFSLKPVGQESSKFVDDAAQATYPDYKDLVLEIQ